MPTENKRPHTNIPADFPQFIVPGFENEMHNLRELYWTHYERSGPVSTFEDDWLPRPQLWPATAHNDRMHRIRELWKNSLAKKGMDEEGYVFTHQHRSIAHQHGWPFPFWQENYPGTWGCHFNLDDISDGWHGTSVKSQDGFTSHGVEDQGIIDGLWTLRAASPNAWIETPPLYIDPAQCPFLQLRWKADFNENIQPFVQWKTEDENFYGDNRRMYFDPASEDMTFTQIPMHKNIFWNETKKIIQLRICFNNQHAGAKIFISSLFTTFDTRHTVNNAYYIAACSHYFYWTGDFLFLRENINRMRVALRWMMTVCKGLEEKCIVAPFVGHDGRPGYIINGDGSKTVRPAQGIGSNYWDIIPAGYRDAYASIQYFNALHIMGKLENEIKTKPEWNIPGGAIAFDGNELLRHAGEVRAYGTTNFWNPATKRFTTGYDADGMFYDYGFVFMNLEAMYYGFATVEQCGEIISWLDGERVVEGDTSKGDDIYFWRFGPRS
ncbi:MAG: hypothetical protein FWE82_09655, partial [Defluviitaleaceae bacterium]|nr:hypothetical protein [Defluviitaleaceae bacterium]